MGDFRPVLSRRRLLQVPVVLLVGLGTGCRASAPAPPRPVDDPDVAVRAQIRAQERRLIATYDAAIARYPTMRTALSPVQADHVAHLAAVTDPPPAGSPAGGSVSPRSPGPGTGPVRQSAADTLRGLVAAERVAAAARAADGRRVGANLAGLVISIGGSEAAHAAVLPALLRPAGASGSPPFLPDSAPQSARAAGPLSPAAVAAANRALAGAHAAVYALGVVGARLPRAEQPAATAALAGVRTQRDLLAAVIAAAGGTPVPAEPGYVLPYPVRNRAAALRLAVLVADRQSALDIALAVASTDVGLRSIASAAVAANASDAAWWRLRAGVRPVTVAMPGR